MRRTALLLAVGIVVVSPVLRPERPDGFPLSSYPMFSNDNGRVVRLHTAVGFDAGGGLHRLGARAIGGGSSEEPVLAAESVRVAVRDGETAELCEEIAARVDDDAIVAVEVRTEVRDVVADPEAEDDPLDVEVHARCDR